MRGATSAIACRCCGKPLTFDIDGHPIHTSCITRHWAKHANGVNASRCREFSKKKEPA